MLKVLAVVTLTLAVAMARTDPRAAWCWDKCTEEEDRENECTQGCYPDGQYDEETTGPCINDCSDIAAPCRLRCFETYETCRNQCPYTSGMDN